MPTKKLAKNAGRKKAVASKSATVTKKVSRALKKATKNVHRNAGRARQVGKAVATAGELIEKTADVVDSMAKKATPKKSTARRH